MISNAPSHSPTRKDLRHYLLAPAPISKTNIEINRDRRAFAKRVAGPAWLHSASRSSTKSNTGAWLDALIRRRDTFGITRIGSLTRLDRTGIPVVQVSRPLALSNAVSQGKGLNWADATASALMEAIETWASERFEGDVKDRVLVADVGLSGQDLCPGP